MYRYPIEVYTVSTDYMFLTFYKASFMDSELMDHIISHWKIDQQMNVVYRSGERVLLCPLFITVFLLPPFCYFSDVGELHCYCITKDSLFE